MTVSFRALTRDDIPRLVELDRVLEFSPWTEAMFEGSLEKAQEGTEALALGVVDEDDRPIAYLIIDVLAFAGEAEVFTVGVDPNYQRQGLAKALFAEALAMLSRLIPQGNLFLEVRESNEAARSLYTRLGFEEVGFRKDYYQTATGREGALLMRLALDTKE